MWAGKVYFLLRNILVTSNLYHGFTFGCHWQQFKLGSGLLTQWLDQHVACDIVTRAVVLVTAIWHGHCLLSCSSCQNCALSYEPHQEKNRFLPMANIDLDQLWGNCTAGQCLCLEY